MQAIPFAVNVSQTNSGEGIKQAQPSKPKTRFSEFFSKAHSSENGTARKLKNSEKLYNSDSTSQTELKDDDDTKVRQDSEVIAIFAVPIPAVANILEGNTEIAASELSVNAESQTPSLEITDTPMPELGNMTEVPDKVEFSTVLESADESAGHEAIQPEPEMLPKSETAEKAEQTQTAPAAKIKTANQTVKPVEEPSEKPIAEPMAKPVENLKPEENVKSAENVEPEVKTGELEPERSVEFKTEPDTKTVSNEQVKPNENSVPDTKPEQIKYSTTESEPVAVAGQNVPKQNTTEQTVMIQTEQPVIQAEQPDIIVQADEQTQSLEMTDGGEPILETGSQVSEKMARTPETDKPLKTQKKNREVSDVTEQEAACPLENESEEAVTKTTQKHSEYDGSDESTGETAQPKQAQTDFINPVITRPFNIGAERLRSQPVTAMQHTGPVTTDNLFEAMIERIEMLQTTDAKSMTIDLKPGFLGKVSLSLILQDTGLHVKISADDMSVKNMIGNQVSSLIETLNIKGLEGVKVDVVYTGVDNGAFTDMKGDSNRGEPQRRGNTVRGRAIGRRAGLEPMSIQELAAMLDIDSEISSVEYRA